MSRKSPVWCKIFQIGIVTIYFYRIKSKFIQMKLILTIMTCMLLSVNTVMAQWLTKASFPGVSRAKATAFTIGSKIYVLGGVTNSSVILDDFWEYDITLNTWTQKPNFPGPERYGA